MATRKAKTETTSTELVKEVAKKNRRIPLDVEVCCVSNVKGSLIYKSSRNGGINADWDEFGSMQYLDIRELLSMRNTQKRFFDDNWIVLQDTEDGEYTADDIYKFLGVSERYGDYYDCDNIDTFFDLTPKQMKDKVTKVSNGIKELLISVAIDKFKNGEIDSVKKKQAIKDALGIGDEED
jgi:hypothetical protein